MDKVRDIVLYVAAAFAIFSLICAVYQAMNERLSSAGVLAGIFFVCTMIVFIPRLEVLKAWGVEARLRESLSEANAIIERLNRLSAISAKVSYMTLAWGNRMGAPTAKDKQALLDEVDQQIADLKLTPSERAEITKPYMRLVAFDLYLIAVQVFERYGTVKHNELSRRYGANQNEDTRSAVQKFTDQKSEWMSKRRGEHFQRITKNNFAGEVSLVTTASWLDEREQNVADGFKRQLIALFEACELKGGFTSEAAEFYDRYHDLGGVDAKMKELFGASLN